MRVHLGERMTLRFRVNNKEGKTFTITGGDYTVSVNDEIVAAGPLIVKEHELSFLFTPEKAGIHRLSIWYDIGTDRRKGEFLIEVV